MQIGSEQLEDDLQMDVRPAHDLLQAVSLDDVAALQEILDDPSLTPTQVNWQDQLGWTPLIYAAFRGDYKLAKRLINRGASINHMALSRAGSSADGTTPLHACAAMRPGPRTTKEGFYETARVLMLAGGNPYQENLSGLTPIDVSANCNNQQMKVLLEGCALFKGTLALPIPKLFGGKISDRYCLVLPRFPWHPLGNQNGLLMRDGNPTLSLVCYKEPEDLKPVIRIPLDGARMVVEGGTLADEGFLIIKAARKVLKGVMVKSSTSNSCIVEVRARPSSTQTAGQVLQSLAEVCKSAAVAGFCGNLGHLCEASMIEALHNLGLADGLLPMHDLGLRGDPAAGQHAMNGHSLAPELAEEGLEPVAEVPKRRKSLSLSRLGKAAMRRLSIGDKPRRHSMSVDRPSNGTMPDMYPSTRSRQRPLQNEFSRISEENSESGNVPQPVVMAPLSTRGALGDEPVRAQRRLSLQQDDLPHKPPQHANRRRSLQLRYSQSKEILTSNQGIPMEFWGGMREDMMRRSIDGRQRMLGGRLSAASGTPPFTPSQPANVRGPYDIGDLDDGMQTPSVAATTLRLSTAASSRATGILDARRPEDSTMQDWVQQVAEQYDPESYEQWKRPTPAVPAVLLSPPFLGSPVRTADERPAGLQSPAMNLSNRRSSAVSEGNRRKPPSPLLPAPSTPSPQAKREQPRIALSEGESMSRSKAMPQGLPGHEPRVPSKPNGVPPNQGSLLGPAAPPTISRSRPPPIVSVNTMARTPTNRSEKSKSSSKAPRPAGKSGMSSVDWFSSAASAEDDLFHWDLRPESHRTPRNLTHQQSVVATVKPPVDPAVARWAAEAAAMVKDEQHLTQAAIDEMTAAGWRGSPVVQENHDAAAFTRQPSGEDLPSLDGNEAPAVSKPGFEGNAVLYEDSPAADKDPEAGTHLPASASGVPPAFVSEGEPESVMLDSLGTEPSDLFTTPPPQPVLPDTDTDESTPKILHELNESGLLHAASAIDESPLPQISRQHSVASSYFSNSESDSRPVASLQPPSGAHRPSTRHNTPDSKVQPVSLSEAGVKLHQTQQPLDDLLGEKELVST